MNIANVITFIRIIGTLVLVWMIPFSKKFFYVYTFTGITDALDGFCARKFKCASELGAKLDSVADLVFYSVMMLKILPVLYDILPRWIWLMVAAVVFLRVISYSVTAFKTHRFMSNHTYLNKLTGICVFLIPYIVHFTHFDTGFSILACIVAALAAVQELAYSIRLKKFS